MSHCKRVAAGNHVMEEKIVRTRRFVGRRRLASRGTALILAFGLSLTAPEAYSDGDSSKAPESKTLHAGEGGQPGKEQSEGGDSPAESGSPLGGIASDGEQGTDKGDGTAASDGSPGGASVTPSGSSAGDGPTPGGGKTTGIGASSLNFPTKVKGWEAGQANNSKILSKSKKGRFLSAGRQQAEEAQGGERRTTEDAANRHPAELQQGKSSFHIESSGKTRLHGANSAEVDGTAGVVTYADAGGKSYCGWYWLRAFSTSTSAVYVLVSYMCPASACPGSELTKIIEKSGLSVDNDVLGGIVSWGGAVNEAAPPRIPWRNVR